MTRSRLYRSRPIRRPMARSDGAVITEVISRVPARWDGRGYPDTVGIAIPTLVGLEPAPPGPPVGTVSVGSYVFNDSFPSAAGFGELSYYPAGGSTQFNVHRSAIGDVDYGAFWDAWQTFGADIWCQGPNGVISQKLDTNFGLDSNNSINVGTQGEWVVESGTWALGETFEIWITDET